MGRTKRPNPLVGLCASKKQKLTKKASASASSAAPLPPAGGPGSPMEIVFSFDTTGSMYGCLIEVREKIQAMIQRLTADIPALRIAVFAHGDYCDKANYITKHIDFCADVSKLCSFVKDVGQTGGGDADECYELVLRQVQEDLSWTAGTQRALVMIGDCNPHEPNYPQNTRRINWRHEIKQFREAEIKIYSVQCKSNGGANNFYKTIAEETRGQRVELSNFDNVFDFLMAICYREAGAEFFDAYEKEVRSRDKVSTDVDCMLGTLRADGEHSGDVTPESFSSKIAPAPPRKILKAVRTKDKKVRKAVRKIVFTDPEPSLAEAVADTPPGSDDDARYILPDTPIPALSSSSFLFDKAEDENVLYSLAQQKREAVRGKRFLLHALPWSRWRVAIKMSGAALHRNWKLYKNGTVARSIVFSESSRLASAWEMGVQTEKNGIMPVYLHVSPGFKNAKSWKSIMLNKKQHAVFINKVLKKDGKIMIRRALLNSDSLKKSGFKSLADLRASVKMYLTYAWQ